MDAPKIQISQLLSETTKDCDNFVITVLCLSVTKEIPCCETLRKTNHLHIIQNFFQGLHKRIHVLIDNFHNDRPIDSIIIMYQPVAQTRHHIPRLFRIGLLKFGA